LFLENAGSVSKEIFHNPPQNPLYFTILIAVCMTTAPVYTSKIAIIVGAVIALGAGIAIGATIVADVIDRNSLAEYRSSPKVSSLVILSDDVQGNAAGWNPGISEIEYQEGSATIKDKREIIQFNIADTAVTKDSIVYAVHTENRQVSAASGISSHMAIIDIPCTTIAKEGGFTAYCGMDNNNWPREGAQLKYFAIVPE
jgi:hypothetical protein